ncbi:hypothetical protein HMP0015_1267 [Acinetobacter haemolyticus ATCC 19194]|uniref:Uncharacterized protein n=1 Tax=Acinetobacter haemolyticus ATCC 19194 TaxID=707232 RepID=D4XNH5_ACIHA|nr:hypothetical protein HMP0015_1267 [Acinetobacter haemolyticus ATCC 19194]
MYGHRFSTQQNHQSNNQYNYKDLDTFYYLFPVLVLFNLLFFQPCEFVQFIV